MSRHPDAFKPKAVAVHPCPSFTCDFRDQRRRLRRSHRSGCRASQAGGLGRGRSPHPPLSPCHRRRYRQRRGQVARLSLLAEPGADLCDSSRVIVGEPARGAADEKGSTVCMCESGVPTLTFPSTAITVSSPTSALASRRRWALCGIHLCPAKPGSTVMTRRCPMGIPERPASGVTGLRAIPGTMPDLSIRLISRSG